MSARPRTQAGFTVTELMVVVAIVGIIAALAAPDMAEMVRRQRVKTAAFDVFAGLTMARSEAIKRNITVQVTPRNGDWTQGFIVLDANDRAVRDQEGWQRMTVAGPNLVRFNSSGRLSSGGGGPVSISIVAPDTYANYGKRCVTVEPTGRASSKEGAC
jgi:type IV fimbrial biogenesis protein FimT